MFMMGHLDIRRRPGAAFRGGKMMLGVAVTGCLVLWPVTVLAGSPANVAARILLGDTEQNRTVSLEELWGRLGQNVSQPLSAPWISRCDVRQVGAGDSYEITITLPVDQTAAGWSGQRNATKAAGSIADPGAWQAHIVALKSQIWAEPQLSLLDRAIAWFALEEFERTGSLDVGRLTAWAATRELCSEASDRYACTLGALELWGQFCRGELGLDGEVPASLSDWLRGLLGRGAEAAQCVMDCASRVAEGDVEVEIEIGTAGVTVRIRFKTSSERLREFMDCLASCIRGLFGIPTQP